MQTHIPNLPERYTILMEQLRPAPGAGPMAWALCGLFLALMRLLASFVERGPQQQVCQEDAGVGEDAGVERGRVRTVRPATPALRTVQDAGGRVAVGVAVAAADSAQVIDGATEDDCIVDEGGMRGACGRPQLARSRGPSLFWRTEVAFWWPDSQKSVCGRGWNFVNFVTI
jgi:hypothetical protein